MKAPHSLVFAAACLVALTAAFVVGMKVGELQMLPMVKELNCHHHTATYNPHTPIAVVDGICAEIWGNVP